MSQGRLAPRCGKIVPHPLEHQEAEGVRHPCHKPPLSLFLKRAIYTITEIFTASKKIPLDVIYISCYAIYMSYIDIDKDDHNEQI